ncbi:asparagine synthase (glutamine-hydrolyzing) [Gammaproteobacteria bacterium]|nr:asparagine synthase (glutamine-hydrolyzing) [Gammaproteobacteria bacterium]MDA8798620.1 asparagine synthase (glutamine-hydrolyzing) [Gammaproteobacteria bacterium]
MCGIAGQWSLKEINKDNFIKKAQRLDHRGPDHFGSWFDDNHNLALAHLRLSILDLSIFGNQPMESHSSRYILVYNGEIYNFTDLKKEILIENSTFKFQGSSDTEVLLAAIELFGFNTAIQKCNGMFAMALWDKKNKLLYLARDRFGEKPLYYYINSNNVSFASELKVFESPNANLKLSQTGINLFLSQGNIPAPNTIYKNIYKVRPGEILIFSSPLEHKSELYWDIESISLNQKITSREVDNQFESLFLESVSRQMISDVPLGAFLSGGIDSSAVVSAMTEVSSKKVQTYSIGFQENNYNEAITAKRVAKHLGTDHHEFYLTEKDALDVIPRLQKIYCEPFADSSQIPTYLLCKETKKDVTVCLSGDGGDEIFGGYRRYIDIQRFNRLIKSTPLIVRTSISKFLELYLRIENRNIFDGLIKRLLNLSHPTEQLYKASNVLVQRDLREIFYSLAMQWNKGTAILKSGNTIDASSEIDKIFHPSFEDIYGIRKLDIKNYLSNDILVKVDRAAMSNSLETRIPFLDLKLTEFGLSLPVEFLIKGSKGKLPIRSFLQKRVPKEVLQGPKSGFGVPIEHWLRNRLRPWAESLLTSASNLENLGLDQNKVFTEWDNFQSNGLPLHHDFWNILILLAWCEEHVYGS